MDPWFDSRLWYHRSLGDDERVTIFQNRMQVAHVAENNLEQLLAVKATEFAPHYKPGFLPREETVFQFHFTSSTDNAPFFLYVTPGSFEFCAGEHPAPTIRVQVSDLETCWGLLDGRLDGMKAFMEGKYRADGNIVLSQLLLYLFKSNDPTIAYEIQY